MKNKGAKTPTLILENMSTNTEDSGDEVVSNLEQIIIYFYFIILT